MPAIRQLIFFPILFAIYPALNLYASNAGTVEPSKGLLPVVLIAGFMALLYFAVSRLIRQSTSAALFTTAIGVFVFYYGYLFNGLRNLIHFDPRNLHLAHTIFLTVWLYLLVVIFLNVYRRRVDKPTVNTYLNGLSLVMVGLPLLTLTPQLLAANSVSTSEPQRGRPLNANIELAEPPDVYYIILDGYGRDDVLAEQLGLDNHEFLDGLEQRGFYVARESCANYAMTYTSLPSSLNMDYLDVLAPGATSTAAMIPLFHENRVLRTFNNLGYTTIHFATLWTMTRESPESDIVYQYDQVDPYHRILVDTTLLAALLVPAGSPEAMGGSGWVGPLRAVTTETIQQLKRIPTMPERTFTFAHLIIPHPPYLFDREGNLPEYATLNSEQSGLVEWRPLEGYGEQALYINDQITQVIDAILSQSETPPIIIVQGDHGPQIAPRLEPHVRLPILNAYYLPEGGDHYLYPDISPVNSFRLVFDLYFGAAWGLVEGVYHFSDYDKPLEVVLATCPPRGDNSR